MKTETFQHSIDAVRAAIPANLTLRHYLRALARVLHIAEPDAPFTMGEFTVLLERAMTETPADLAPEVKCPGVIHTAADLQALLAAQVEDLWWGEQEHQKDPLHTSLGVTAPSGQRWFNLEVDSFLECATAGMIAHGLNEQEHVDWRWIGEFLQLGQIYE